MFSKILNKSHLLFKLLTHLQRLTTFCQNVATPPPPTNGGGGEFDNLEDDDDYMEWEDSDEFGGGCASER